MTDTPESTTSRVRAVLRRDLNLPDDLAIEDDAPLFGGQFDLDSLDALMIVASVEKAFGIRIPNEQIGREALYSVHSLAAYLDEQLSSAQPGAAASARVPGPVEGDALHALLKQLPHGEPFRFVTRLDALTPGVSGQGRWEVHGQEAFFAGHFPGRPVVPGVLIAEALAQLSGLVAASTGAGSPGGRATPGSIAHMDMRYRQSAAPPVTITLQSEHVRGADALHEFKVSAQVNDQVLADGTLSLRLG